MRFYHSLGQLPLGAQSEALILCPANHCHFICFARRPEGIEPWDLAPPGWENSLVQMKRTQSGTQDTPAKL